MLNFKFECPIALCSIIGSDALAAVGNIGSVALAGRQLCTAGNGNNTTPNVQPAGYLRCKPAFILCRGGAWPSRGIVRYTVSPPSGANGLAVLLLLCCVRG